jgi:hypothetical protein
MAGVKKGSPSRSKHVAEVVLDLTHRLDVAVHLDEVEAELRIRYPDDADFDVANVLARLCTRGVVELVFGRPPHGRYAHRDHLIYRVPANEPMAAAVAVVERIWAETGLEVPTAAATDAMRVLGVDLPDPRNYRLLLDALTRPSTRGALAWREPKLEARSVTTLDGLARTLWRPAGTSVPDGRTPVSGADMAMEAVARTEEILGLPPSRPHVLLWGATHAESDTVAECLMKRGGLGRALEQLSEERVQRHVHGKGNWRVIPTPLISSGDAPERYTLKPVEGDVLAALELEDRLMMFRPADELESLSAARFLSRRLESPVLDEINAHRTRLLSAVIWPAVDKATRDESVRIITQANDTLTSWARSFHVNARGGKLEPHVALRRQLDALARVAVPSADSDDPSGVVVGEAATAGHQDLLPYVSSVPRLLGRAYTSAESLRMFYARARRVHNREARWERNEAKRSLIPQEREGLGWMLVDRVDAMTAIWEAVSPPRAMSLLNPARAVLGHLIRDVRRFEKALEALPAARADARRPIMLALALLGGSVPYEVALPRPDDEVDTAAYLLSLVLCDSDRSRLSQAIARVAVGATSAEARRTVSEADRRISGGVLLSVVG